MRRRDGTEIKPIIRNVLTPIPNLKDPVDLSKELKYSSQDVHFSFSHDKAVEIMYREIFLEYSYKQKWRANDFKKWKGKFLEPSHLKSLGKEFYDRCFKDASKVKDIERNLKDFDEELGENLLFKGHVENIQCWKLCCWLSCCDCSIVTNGGSPLYGYYGLRNNKAKLEQEYEGNGKGFSRKKLESNIKPIVFIRQKNEGWNAFYNEGTEEDYEPREVFFMDDEPEIISFSSVSKWDDETVLDNRIWKKEMDYFYLEKFYPEEKYIFDEAKKKRLRHPYCKKCEKIYHNRQNKIKDPDVQKFRDEFNEFREEMRSEVNQEVNRVWDYCNVSQGQIVSQFQEEFQKIRSEMRSEIRSEMMTMKKEIWSEMMTMKKKMQEVQKLWSQASQAPSNDDTEISFSEILNPIVVVSSEGENEEEQTKITKKRGEKRKKVGSDTEDDQEQMLETEQKTETTKRKKNASDADDEIGSTRSKSKPVPCPFNCGNPQIASSGSKVFEHIFKNHKDKMFEKDWNYYRTQFGKMRSPLWPKEGPRFVCCFHCALFGSVAEIKKRGATSSCSHKHTLPEKAKEEVLNFLKEQYEEALKNLLAKSNQKVANEDDQKQV